MKLLSLPLNLFVHLYQLVSIPKRGLEAMKQREKYKAMPKTVVSIPKRGLEAMKPHQFGLNRRIQRRFNP